MSNLAENRADLTDIANALVIAHLERARVFVLRIVRGSGLETDEAIARANAALVESAHRFLDEGHNFWSYARHRAGAVFDFLDEDAPVPFVDSLLVEDCVEQRYAVAELLADLDERPRQILIEHYWRGRTLAEIAESLQISAVRVSQIHHDALAQLRERLGADAESETNEPVSL